MIFRRRKKSNKKTIFIRYKKRKNNSPFRILLFLLLIAMGVYLYLYQEKTTSPTTDFKQNSQPLQEEIEKEIQKSDERGSLGQQKVKIRDIKNQNSNNFVNTPSSNKFPSRDKVSLEQERQFDEILKLMEADDEDEHDIENQVARYRLIERKIKEPLEQEHDEDSRELFIQKFLENARRGGYEIQLNEDLKVISIKKSTLH